MSKHIISLIACTIFSLAAICQSAVNGIIIDKNSKKVIQFATASVLFPADSSILNSAVTDKKGKFIVDNIPPGNYLLKSTFIGYEPSLKTIVVLPNQPLDAGIIDIYFMPLRMKDVTIISNRALLNASIDRKIYNVDQDIMAQSGSASDILKNIPSVEVDLEGNISLRGSGDVLILVNGRPSPMMGKTRAEVLQQLPANTIARIEVITNPSARFKPDGTAGIINIVLKKNTKNGLNGSITGNASNRNRYNTNINLNYKPGKLNLFGNFSMRKDNRTRIATIDRGEFNPISFYFEDIRSVAKPLTFLGTLGADYEFNEQNSIGISGSFVSREQVKKDIAQKYYYDQNKILTARYDRLRYDPESEKEREASIYWQHNFKKEDHELRIEFNTSIDKETEDNHYTDIYYFPLQPRAFDNTLIQQNDEQQNLTADYTLPIGEDAKLESGYEGNFNQLDQNFYGEFFDTAQLKFLMDIAKTNRFIYKDQQHALYITYQKAFEKFSYAAGMRFEQVFIRGNLVTLDSSFKNDYFKLYPTLHLSYKLPKGELQLNYSRRVNRPDGDELNPFPEYRDPRNLSAGNPKLLPELIHSVEIGYQWQNKNFSFVPSLYYRYRHHGFTSVTYKINDSTLLTTEQNLSNDKSAGLELIFSAKDNKFFNSNLSSNFFYNTIDATDLGYSNKKSIISISTNINATFTLTKSTMLQVSSNIRSGRVTPQGKSHGSFVFNSGVRQDLFNKKMSIIFTVSDIFKTQRQRSDLNTSFIQQTTTNRRDARLMYLGISYRFGSIKKAKEEMQFDDSL